MSDQTTLEAKELTVQERLALPMSYQWRVKSFYPKGKPGTLEPGTKGQFLAYIDARNVYDRLDEVVGADNWEDSWEPIPGTPAASVDLSVTINGQTVRKSDVGYPNSERDEEPLKSAVSDGIKRAAVHFGIGRFLYSLEPVWVEVDKWGKPLRPIGDGLDLSTDASTDNTPAGGSTAPQVASGNGVAGEKPEDTEPGTCEHCGKYVNGKGVYWSVKKCNGHVYCYDDQQRVLSGEILDAKENIESQSTADAVRELDRLPFDVNPDDIPDSVGEVR